MREVLAIDRQTKLEPVLQFFKRGEFQMGIVTEVEVGELGGCGDPVLKRVGIVTLEDIIEELLQEEIQDERDHRANRGGQRKRIR